MGLKAGSIGGRDRQEVLPDTWAAFLAKAAEVQAQADRLQEPNSRRNCRRITAVCWYTKATCALITYWADWSGVSGGVLSNGQAPKHKGSVHR